MDGNQAAEHHCPLPKMYSTPREGPREIEREPPWRDRGRLTYKAVSKLPQPLE